MTQDQVVVVALALAGLALLVLGVFALNHGQGCTSKPVLAEQTLAQRNCDRSKDTR